MTKLYRLRLWHTPFQWQAHALQEKDGAYLSRHGRLASGAKAARFLTARAAQLCLTLWLPTLQSRWGAALRVELEELISNAAEPLEVETDAVTLLARARSGCFASNQLIPCDALGAAREELRQLERAPTDHGANVAHG